MYGLTLLYSILKYPLRPFRRMTRGMTLGAQAIVVDGDDRVLLVRHSYVKGWHLPGGGVEWRESLTDALDRELAEETGVVRTGPAVLHGVFTNFENIPGDHITVFILREWRQPQKPLPNLEIREQRFVSPDDLPADTGRGTRNRLREVFDGIAIDEKWV